MSKLCKKEDCDSNSVKQSKYCIEHCSKKLRDKVLNEEEVNNRRAMLFQAEEMKQQELELERRTIEEVRILEERFLREEQEKEYEETLKQDLERMNQKEFERELRVQNDLERINHKIQVENDNRIEIEKKRQNVTYGENDELFYKFKFSVLTVSTLVSFPEKSSVSNLFDYVDVFIYDNKTDTKFENGYELILYPNITITKMMSNNRLSDIIKTCNNKISVKEIELE